MSMRFHPLSGLWRSYKRYIENIETLIVSLRKDVPLSDDDIQKLFEKPELELELDYSYEEATENISSFPGVLRRSAFLSAFILLYKGDPHEKKTSLGLVAFSVVSALCICRSLDQLNTGMFLN